MPRFIPRDPVTVQTVYPLEAKKYLYDTQQAAARLVGSRFLSVVGRVG
jgi:hypothetical protein